MGILKEVAEHFRESSDYRLRTSRGLHHPFDADMIDLIRKNLDTDSRILEVGGGSGYKLDLIARETGLQEAYNCELVAETYRTQAREDIGLITGNAIDLPFAGNTFDLVLAVNLLHHLVGLSPRESRRFQVRAVCELVRVTRYDGFLIVGEVCCSSALVRRIIYAFCMIASMHSVEIPRFGLTKGVVVYFLTPDELLQMIDSHDQIVKTTSEAFGSRPSRRVNLKDCICTLLQRHVMIVGKKICQPA